MIITDSIARRLEGAEAGDAADCVESANRQDPDCCATAKEIAGGVIAFCGNGSPLTHAIGAGLRGVVTGDELGEIEDFYFSRGAGVSIDLCPHADPGLRELLVARGYELAEMNNVLVRALQPEDSWSVSISIEAATNEEEFATTLTRGFFGRDMITADEYLLGQTLFHMPSARSLIARLNGEAAGGCGLSMRSGVASLYGDAVLTRYRGRGVHLAMICSRLNAAVEAGCDLATAGTVPGGISQRNYQRLGFEVAYTKATMVLPFAQEVG